MGLKNHRRPFVTHMTLKSCVHQENLSGPCTNGAQRGAEPTILTLGVSFYNDKISRAIDDARTWQEIVFFSFSIYFFVLERLIKDNSSLFVTQMVPKCVCASSESQTRTRQEMGLFSFLSTFFFCQKDWSRTTVVHRFTNGSQVFGASSLLAHKISWIFISLILTNDISIS